MTLFRKNAFAFSALWLIAMIGLIVPRQLRSEWKQEWEAELRHREALLSDWERLNWRTKLDLPRRSLGAFRDALFLQPRRCADFRNVNHEYFRVMRIPLLKGRSFTEAEVRAVAKVVVISDVLARRFRWSNGWWNRSRRRASALCCLACFRQ